MRPVLCRALFVCECLDFPRVRVYNELQSGPEEDSFFSRGEAAFINSPESGTIYSFRRYKSWEECITFLQVRPYCRRKY